MSLIAAALITLAVTAPALAQQSGGGRGIDSVCPPHGTNERDFFVDDEGSVHEDAINCAAHWGIVSGHTGDTYRPRDVTTRGQLATFIVRWVEVGRGDEMERGPDAFPDDDGSVHEENIDKAANAGLIRGFPDGTFRPRLAVSRAQLATFVAESLRFFGTPPPEASSDYFDDDDGSPHELNINELREARVLTGTGGRLFAPQAPVTRGAQATLGMQAADYAEETAGWGRLEHAD